MGSQAIAKMTSVPQSQINVDEAASLFDLRQAKEMNAARKAFDECSASKLPQEKTWFVPAGDGSWRSVRQDEICEGGLEYRIDMSTGKTFARLKDGQPRVNRVLPDSVIRDVCPASARARSGRAFGDGTLFCGQKVLVECITKGRNEGKFLSAIIRKVHKSGKTVNVEYVLDGCREMEVSRSRIQS